MKNGGSRKIKTANFQKSNLKYIEMSVLQFLQKKDVKFKNNTKR